jgi:hypothetical protein
MCAGHGLIHLLGAAKALGWAEVPALHDPISPATGLVWLAAALLVLGSGMLLAVRAPWWWLAGAIAGAVSQTAILTSWNDAKVGTAANVVLLVAAGYAFASQGPTSFRAGFHGRFRSDARAPWMRFTGEQVSTYGARTSRVFAMHATLFGLPVDVLHVFIGPAATMRVKACSVVPMVDSAGPDMDRGETAALVDAPVVWHAVDDTHACGTFTNGAHTVSADVTFDDEGDLVDFVSDDRLQASRDGATFTTRRWSTPVRDYRTFGTRRLATRGECRWHAPEPQGQYCYLEFTLDHITYNPTTSPGVGGLTMSPDADSARARRRPVPGTSPLVRAFSSAQARVQQQGDH